ncbi:potassium-transporting ATPase subunit KdpA [Tsukamurella sp. 8F]|uniref:potassium-transporting ATPase subunit KdpA n=1 Tax=unclassified Tsukamurella TaxID=2633480 RepID=UPI0023B8D9E0|nr:MULTISPECIES: potassium-transporting ATPase subunit KdpA [unclassified Tsukamurella]MDF0530281.1 potassium-transporting ATPase subunit KdpA [Tsukamurella sp. 8J]MDF0588599.1 potassium-transporting ATPase subunit KdpA [Tsukamurella sp. 8F]
MSDTVAGLLTVATVLLALAICYRPLGDAMAHAFTAERHWRVERWVYRAVGVDPDAEQTYRTYAVAALAFSAVCVVVLTALLMLQGLLPGVHPSQWRFDQALNTAISFVTNTNWQWYSGESAMNNIAQTAGLAVQNFVSAAVGVAVAVALVRGFVRQHTDRLGNFWVDLTRCCVRVLLPLSAVGAIVLLSQGVVQTLWQHREIATVAGGRQLLTGGLVASQEAIKLLGTNGGGFFNANSAHPFENPTAFTNAFEVFLILLIPVAMPRVFGNMVGNHRQGYAILGAMTAIFTASLAVTTWAQLAGQGAASRAAGAALEGQEWQFGQWGTSLFATATTSTSTGAVNAAHDSLTPGAGGMTILNMVLGEVSPGGVGSGLYGMLVIAVITVFLSGLMVGRTPEYLGKKIRRPEITLAALYVLVMPAVVLVGTGFAIGQSWGRAAMTGDGPHGLSELLYAYASAANNNGSAFAGLGVNTQWFDYTLGGAMLLGRFVPLVLVLMLAGSLAQQQKVPVTDGTIPTHRPLFVTMTVGVVLLVAGLTFVPALALGPISETAL